MAVSMVKKSHGDSGLRRLKLGPGHFGALRRRRVDSCLEDLPQRRLGDRVTETDESAVYPAGAPGSGSSLARRTIRCRGSAAV